MVSCFCVNYRRPPPVLKKVMPGSDIILGGLPIRVTDERERPGRETERKIHNGTVNKASTPVKALCLVPPQMMDAA